MVIANPEFEIGGFPGQMPWLDALERRREVPASPAVYAITTRDQFARLVLSSCVLYVGKTAQLGGAGDNSRLYAYRYQPHRYHGGRIRSLAERVIAAGHHLVLKWKVLRTEQEAIEAESALLNAYYETAIELPPFNRKLGAA